MSEKYVPIRPVRDKNENFVKYENEGYPNLPNIKESIKEYHKSSPPQLEVNASKEEILKKYLKSIFISSFDKDSEFQGKLAIHSFQYTYARDTCKNLGFVKNNKITDKGIEFLKYLQQKEILEKQNKINWLLVAVTAIMAIGTILNVMILLLK